MVAIFFFFFFFITEVQGAVAEAVAGVGWGHLFSLSHGVGCGDAGLRANTLPERVMVDRVSVDRFGLPTVHALVGLLVARQTQRRHGHLADPRGFADRGRHGTAVDHSDFAAAGADADDFHGAGHQRCRRWVHGQPGQTFSWAAETGILTRSAARTGGRHAPDGIKSYIICITPRSLVKTGLLHSFDNALPATVGERDSGVGATRRHLPRPRNDPVVRQVLVSTRHCTSPDPFGGRASCNLVS